MFDSAGSSAKTGVGLKELSVIAARIAKNQPIMAFLKSNLRFFNFLIEIIASLLRHNYIIAHISIFVKISYRDFVVCQKYVMVMVILW